MKEMKPGEGRQELSQSILAEAERSRIGLAGCEEMREDQGTQLISSSRHSPKGGKLFHEENVRP